MNTPPARESQNSPIAAPSLSPPSSGIGLDVARALKLADVSLKYIEGWRKTAHEYDDDMGYDRRDFDEETVEQIEQYAKEQRAAISSLSKAIEEAEKSGKTKSPTVE